MIVIFKYLVKFFMQCDKNVGEHINLHTNANCK